MTKNLKRFFSMVLALSLVFGLVIPTTATKVHAHDHAEEAKQEESINLETVLENITVNTDNMEFVVDLANKIVLADPNTEVDTEDPAIIAFESNLKAIKVWDEAAQQPVPLTEEQIQQVLGLYQQYLNHWAENADTLGLQVPFFLDYNDQGEDGLGALGEMLALAGVPVDAVRAGYMTMDDLTGMILNFYYGDLLGVQFYGAAIEAARDEVMQLIEESGAITEAQKLLVINDWLAHNNTFDMPYIMNADKDTNGDGVIDENDDNTDPMVAENPVKHEHYDDVLAVMTEVYTGILTDTFETQIRDGLEAEFKRQYYTEAIKNIIYQGGLADARQNPDLIAALKEQLGWLAVYEAALEAAKKAVYDEAYAQYLLDNHEHELTIALVWTETTDEEGNVTAYNCEEATATCGYEGCTTELTVAVELVTETVDAECEVDGKTTYTATATVTVPGDEEGETVVVGETEETKEVVIPALGHNMDEGVVTTEPGCETEGVKTFSCQNTGCDYTETEAIAAVGHKDEDADNVCDVCEVTIHAHNAKVTIVWAEDNTATATAVCTTEGCTDTLTAEVTVTSVVDQELTCGQDGKITYTAKVESVTTSEGTTVANYSVENAEKVVTTPATGEHTYDDVKGDGLCTVCGAPHEDHYDNTDDGYCDKCGVKMPATVNLDAETVAEDGEGTETEPTDPEVTDPTEPSEPEVDPEADAYAKAVVEEKLPELEAAAAAQADEETHLNEAIEQAVTGGTEDVDTDIEKEVWKAAEDYVAQEEVAAALAEDPAGFVDSQEMFQQEVPVTDADGNYIIGEDGNPVMMPLSQQLHMGWDQFWADAQEKGVEVDPVNAPGVIMTVDQIVAQQMDTPMADLPQKEDGTHMTPNEAVPVFAAQAAAGLTDGIINYWEGSHFGALGFGTSVCLGYTKAFTYLVQCLHPEIYGVNGAETDMSVAENWKTRDEVYVYGEDGKIDINQNYVVDAVRVTFDASVTMYGQTEDNFNSDHFWNAVKIDGKWYYADPCYTDVFTEVMMRDRVETDGQMNHLYFLFSHTAAVNMYDGNYKEIKSMYSEVATDETFEDAWFSRIKSNTYFADGYAYYLYDSTDMLTLMEEYENQNQNSQNSFDDTLYKIVRHKLDADDSGDGDSDYETLVVFNYKADDDSDAVGRVWDEETGATVDNELLTELWKKHEVYTKIYPSIMLNAALYNGKVYFNLANCILSYDVATSEVVLVKEYNTVYGVRDTTKPFGGMAFTTTTASNADFTVENHPIAGMTIKDDGNMYVSIATNFAFISGKADRCDPASEGFGYAYEESNYNSNYNSYMDFSGYDDSQLESYGYTKEINDNDEFMWTANFVEITPMSTLTHSHTYETVSVAAACGVDAYTENRCSSCGAIEDGTRVYEEGTALEHHYVEFHETFYTKDEGDAWNTGVCYVCTECGYAVTEPKEPTGQAAEQEGAMENYEEQKAIFDAAKASAGHDYVATGETWANDYSTVTFSVVECSAICPERKPYLDCLMNDDTITVTLAKAVTLDAVKTILNDCTDGRVEVFTATGDVEVNGELVTITVVKEVSYEPTDCKYVDGVCTVCNGCKVKRIYGEDRIGTALSAANALKDALEVETFDAIILAAAGVGQDQTKFADALSGSYLASSKQVPILLYTTGDLSEKNLAFIEENLSEEGVIYLLGGNVSIPAEVEAALVEAGYNFKRLAGDDRYLTNLAILNEVGVEDAEEVLIAGGQAFADSLSASATGLPILLVNGTKTALTAEQIEFLEKLDGKKVTILGGNAAVTAELEAAIEEIVGADVERIFGETREETSAMVAAKYFPDAELAFIAYSRMYPDGLAGGVLANVMGAPLLLINSGKEEIANAYIVENGIEGGYVLGGSAVIADETAKAVFGLSEEAVIKDAYFTE